MILTQQIRRFCTLDYKQKLFEQFRWSSHHTRLSSVVRNDVNQLRKKAATSINREAILSGKSCIPLWVPTSHRLWLRFSHSRPNRKAEGNFRDRHFADASWRKKSPFNIRSMYSGLQNSKWLTCYGSGNSAKSLLERRISELEINGVFCWIRSFGISVGRLCFVLPEQKKGRNQSLGLPTINLIPSPSCFHHAYSSLCACLVKTRIGQTFHFSQVSIS